MFKVKTKRFSPIQLENNDNIVVAIEGGINWEWFLAFVDHHDGTATILGHWREHKYESRGYELRFDPKISFRLVEEGKARTNVAVNLMGGPYTVDMGPAPSNYKDWPEGAYAETQADHRLIGKTTLRIRNPSFSYPDPSDSVYGLPESASRLAGTELVALLKPLPRK